MGLDIYLRKYDDYEKATKLQTEYEKRSDEIWNRIDKKYEDMTEAEKNGASSSCKAIAAELGLGDWGEYPGKETIEIASVKYPDHLFKVGYFRSSYNGNGFNSVVWDFIGGDLHSTFPHADDDYCFQPNWSESLTLAESMLTELNEAIEKKGAYRIDAVDAPNLFSKDCPESSAEALAMFHEEKADEHSFGSFSSSKGTFYLDKPLQVHALIPGKQFGTDRVYIVFSHEEGLDWYVQALEIVIETIKWVLACEDIEKYYLSWSG